MNKLILLRHGQSQWNLENRFTGWEDIPLTTKGINEDFYLSSFGEDGKGELYILNHTGSIYKLVGVE